MYKHDFNETLFDEFLTDVQDEINAHKSYFHDSLESDVWDAAVEYIRDTLTDDGPDGVDEDTCGERAWETLDSHETMIYTARLVDEWVRRGMPDSECDDGGSGISPMIAMAVCEDVNPYGIGVTVFEYYTEALETLRADERYTAILDGPDA